jgi:hypothetical protein
MTVDELTRCADCGQRGFSGHATDCPHYERPAGLRLCDHCSTVAKVVDVNLAGDIRVTFHCPICRHSWFEGTPQSKSNDPTIERTDDE